MNRRIFFITAAALLAIISKDRAWGQLNIIDQTRTLTINTDGAASPTDSDLLTGTYNNSLSGGLSNTFNSFQESDIANASQMSNVSSSVLSAQATASSKATSYLDGPVNVSGDSYYSVDFSVPTPTLFSLTEQFSSSSSNHEGPYNLLADNLTLTSNNGSSPTQLFTAGYQETQDGGDFTYFSYDGPSTTFNATLEPGLTYTLTMNVYTYTPADSTTLGSSPTASLSFVASVPEPTSIATIAAASILLARRRR